MHAKSYFKKEFFKLINNSAFGKSFRLLGSRNISIVDLNKVLMYEYRYHYMKIYGAIARILFSDSYSLAYEIKAVNVCEDSWKNKYFFLNNGFSLHNKSYSDSNKILTDQIMRLVLGWLPNLNIIVII